MHLDYLTENLLSVRQFVTLFFSVGGINHAQVLTEHQSAVRSQIKCLMLLLHVPESAKEINQLETMQNIK